MGWLGDATDKGSDLREIRATYGYTDYVFILHTNCFAEHFLFE